LVDLFLRSRLVGSENKHVQLELMSSQPQAAPAEAASSGTKVLFDGLIHYGKLCHSSFNKFCSALLILRTILLLYHI